MTADRSADLRSRAEVLERSLTRLTYDDEAAVVRDLLAEIAQWHIWGIIEIAVRNPHVSSYMDHWEGRTLKAEAEVDALEKMRTHCDRCGADYMATGSEAGCPCLLKAEVDALTRQRDEYRASWEANTDALGVATTKLREAEQARDHNFAQWALAEAGLRALEQALDAYDQACTRSWPGVHIVHSGRTGAELEAILAAARSLAALRGAP